jgi:hypothetical protein
LIGVRVQGPKFPVFDSNCAAGHGFSPGFHTLCSEPDPCSARRVLLSCTAARCVERNALRAKVVRCAEQWPWPIGRFTGSFTTSCNKQDRREPLSNAAVRSGFVDILSEARRCAMRSSREDALMEAVIFSGIQGSGFGHAAHATPGGATYQGLPGCEAAIRC